MGGVAIQLLRVLRLRETLAECVASKAFRDLKKYRDVADIIMNERYIGICFMQCAKVCIQLIFCFGVLTRNLVEWFESSF